MQRPTAPLAGRGKTETATMDMVYRSLFVLGYVVLVPSLTLFWYTGGRHMERLQRRSLVVMGIAMALILLAAWPYR